MNAANTSLQQQYGAAASYQGMPSNAPKEIGLLQRVEGVRGGLDEIFGRLQTFEARIHGHPLGNDAKAEPPPCGLPGNLSCAEDRIRNIIKTLDSLNSTF